MAGVLVHDTQRTAELLMARPRDLCCVAQARAASGRVHDDGQVAAGERIDVQPSELPRTLAVAGVRVQRATAHLLDRGGDSVPVALEDAHGRSLGVTECLTHHTACEQAYVGV